MAFISVSRIILISLICVDIARSGCKYRESGIVPNVIPNAPLNLMKIAHDGQESNCGEKLERSLTKNAPSVSYPADSQKLYTLVMIDPDAPTPQEPSLRNYRHWLIENIPGDAISKGYTVTQYLQPAPPPYSDAHRYIFLAYEQPGNTKLNDHFGDDFRTHFDLNNFVKERNLQGPIAGNFYYVQQK